MTKRDFFVHLFIAILGIVLLYLNLPEPTPATPQS